MPKIRIKVIALGHLPLAFDKEKIRAWKSDVFEIVDDIDTYSLRKDSDLRNWEYSDTLISGEMPQNIQQAADFCIALVSVPLQDNWYARRLTDNRIIMTFHQMEDVLRYANIPLANIVLRALYSYSLLFLSSDRKIPNYHEVRDYTHDETRGCLFDMNGLKYDIVASCDSPKVCSDCVQKLKNKRVPDGTVIAVTKEIRDIKMDYYFRVMRFVKAHPIVSFVFSTVFALLVGVVASVAASFVYEAVKPNDAPIQEKRK
jgi:hypothetical protein